jgi:hypothetical protein
MSDRLQRLADDRAARNAARDIFNANLRNVVGDLEARGIGQRISDRAVSEVKELANISLDVAKESKGIIAGTIAAILLWLFRVPIIGWAESLFDDEGDEPGDVQPNDSETGE